MKCRLVFAGLGELFFQSDHFNSGELVLVEEADLIRAIPAARL